MMKYNKIKLEEKRDLKGMSITQLGIEPLNHSLTSV